MRRSSSPSPRWPSSSTGSSSSASWRGSGLAASRGGRRSAPGRSRRAPALRRHRHRRDLDRRRRHRRRAPAARARRRAVRRPAGPETVLERALDLVGKLRGRGCGRRGARRRRRRARPGELPRGRAGRRRRSCRAGTGTPSATPSAAAARRPGHGRQRRQHHGPGRAARGHRRSVDDFLFVKIGTGIGCGIVLDGEVYRGVPTAPPATSATSGSRTPARPAPAATTAAWRRSSAVRRCARDAEPPPAPAARRVLAERLRRRAGSPRSTSASPRRPGDPAAVALVRSGGRRLGLALASLVSFFNPGLVVIGGGVAGLGHPLLAEIRSVVYRRSLPLATGNLPIVLSELGDTPASIGAARLVSDSVFSIMTHDTGQPTPSPREEADGRSRCCRCAASSSSSPACARSTASTWRSAPARCTACSARTAPASPP